MPIFGHGSKKLGKKALRKVLVDADTPVMSSGTHNLRDLK
jgi:hypothetical protein